MVESAIVAEFLATLLVSTMVAFVITELFWDQKGFSTAHLAAVTLSRPV